MSILEERYIIYYWIIVYSNDKTILIISLRFLLSKKIEIVVWRAVDAANKKINITWYTAIKMTKLLAVPLSLTNLKQEKILIGYRSRMSTPIGVQQKYKNIFLAFCNILLKEKLFALNIIPVKIIDREGSRRKNLHVTS